MFSNVTNAGKSYNNFECVGQLIHILFGTLYLRVTGKNVTEYQCYINGRIWKTLWDTQQTNNLKSQNLNLLCVHSVEELSEIQQMVLHGDSCLCQYSLHMKVVITIGEKVYNSRQII